MPAPRNVTSSSALTIARCKLLQLTVDLLLGEPVVERQRALETQTGWNVGEQLVDRADADRREHLAQIVFGYRGVAAQVRVAT